MLSSVTALAASQGVIAFACCLRMYHRFLAGVMMNAFTEAPKQQMNSALKACVDVALRRKGNLAHSQGKHCTLTRGTWHTHKRNLATKHSRRNHMESPTTGEFNIY